jgi:hypothetical protein
MVSKGLTLVVNGPGVTAANADVSISWDKLANVGGGVTNPGKGPVSVVLPYDGGLTANGIQNLAMHEFGHAEGLGHSADSALMKANAFSSTKKAPTVADINAAANLAPTADDLAGKKNLWGTAPAKAAAVEKLNIATPAGPMFNYDYEIGGQVGPGFSDPITEFAVDLPGSLTPTAFASDFQNIVVPAGWTYTFYQGGPIAPSDGVVAEDDDEADSPSILSFDATSPSYGILPGDTSGDFTYSSLLAPTLTGSYTNDPDYDSTVFADTLVPSIAVPEPTVMALAGIAGIALLRRARRTSRQG